MTKYLYRSRYLLPAIMVVAIAGRIAIGYLTATSSIDLSRGGLADWPQYGRDQAGTRYAPLDQINRDNVAYLELAWEYHTGDFSDGSDGRPATTFQATPILVDGVLYLATVYGRVIALDPEEAPAFAAQHGLEVDDVPASDEMRAEVQRAVDEVNARVGPVEQIKRFAILPRDLTQETGELTPTLKIKRNVVSEKNAGAIEALYAQ